MKFIKEEIVIYEGVTAEEIYRDDDRVILEAVKILEGSQPIYRTMALTSTQVVERESSKLVILKYMQ